MESDRIGAPPHEVKDAEARPIVRYGVALTIGAVIVFALVFWIFSYFTTRPVSDLNANPMANREQSKPAPPQLEEYPAHEVLALRAHETQVLESYGWVDKKSGTVRVPIDRAMQVVAERGLPTRKEAANK
jgi:hypothetical protein